MSKRIDAVELDFFSAVPNRSDGSIVDVGWSTTTLFITGVRGRLNKNFAFVVPVDIFSEVD